MDRLIAIALALAIAFAVFGFGIMNPQNTVWIQGDTVTTYFGWDAYRHDPNHFYPIATDRTSWPLPMPIGMFDSIPLVAFVLKFFAPILPQKFQYLGPVFILGIALQALLGWALLREASPGKSGLAYRTSLILGTLFLTTAPALFNRFYATHVAISQHWPMLLALLVYLRSYRLTYWQTIRDFSLTAFITAGLNPYLMAMVVMIYGGFILKCLIERSLEWTKYVLLMIPMLAGLIGLLTFGFLEPGSAGVFSAAGYGYFSANFLTLIDPSPQSFGSQFIPDLRVHGPGQYEGFGYLGLGMIGLVVASAVIGFTRASPQQGRSTSLPLLAVMLISLLFAMSNVMQFGSYVVAYPLPKGIETLLEHFRSSGRFIWVLVYTLMFVAIGGIIRRLEPRRALALLALGAVVQIADVTGPMVQLHRNFANRVVVEGIAERFVDPVYRGLGAAHDKLLFVPPWQCRLWNRKREEYPQPEFIKFSNLAMESNLPTNSFYGGRTPVIQGFYHCEVFLRKLAERPAERRTAYVLTPRMFALHGSHVARTHSCDFADGMFLCRGDRPAPGLTARAAEAMPMAQAAQAADLLNRDKP